MKAAAHLDTRRKLCRIKDAVVVRAVLDLAHYTLMGYCATDNALGCLMHNCSRDLIIQHRSKLSLYIHTVSVFYPVH